MLQAIRTRAGSFIIKVLFGVLIVSFGVWGIGDIFRGRNPETIVAKVGDEEITVQELQKALEPALARLEEAFGRKFDLREVKKSGFVEGLVQGLVQKSLVAQEVSRLGLVVPGEVIRGAILDNPEFQSPQGQFNRFRFEQLLAANHLTEGEYVARLKEEIPARELLRALTAAAAPPALLLDTLYRYENEKRVAAIAFLPLSSAPEVGPPDPAALSRFYEGHKSLFRAPEYRGFSVASLTPQDLAASIKIPEAKLKEAYREAESSLALPERREVLQILASSEEKAKAAKAALAAGTPFKEVATKTAGESPDTVALGLVTEKELPEPFARVAFALKLDTPSEPVKSAFGWHILEVVKIVPAGRASFAEAKAKILARLQTRQAAGEIYKVGEHVDDALAGGLSLAETAKKFGLKVTKVAAADIGGRDPAGKGVALPVPTKRLLKLAFATEKGRAGRVIHLDDGAIFALAVDKITPPRIKTLEEVKPQAAALLAAQERRQAIAKEAAALAASVSSERPLKVAAAGKGIAVLPSLPLGRRGDGKLPLDLIDKLFAAKPGAVVTAMTKDGAYLAELRAIERPKAAGKNATAALAGSLAGAMRADLGAEFAESLRSRFPVEIHQRVIDRLF